MIWFNSSLIYSDSYSSLKVRQSAHSSLKVETVLHILVLSVMTFSSSV